MQRNIHDPNTYRVAGDVPADKAERLAVARGWFPNENFGRGVSADRLFVLAADKRAAQPQQNGLAPGEAAAVGAPAGAPPAGADAGRPGAPPVGDPPAPANGPANFPVRGHVGANRGSSAWSDVFAAVMRDLNDVPRAMAIADVAVAAVGAAAAPSEHRPAPSVVESVVAEAARAFPLLASLTSVVDVAEALLRATEDARRAFVRVLTSQRAGHVVSESDAVDLRQREDALAELVRTTACRLGEDHGGRVLYEVQCNAPRVQAAIDRFTQVVEVQRALFRTHAAATSTSSSHGSSGGGGSGRGPNNGKRRGRNEAGVVVCYTCGEAGHTSPACPNGSDSSGPAAGKGGKRGGPKGGRGAKKPASAAEAGAAGKPAGQP
jgi:hypothetical protein